MKTSRGTLCTQIFLPLCLKSSSRDGWPTTTPQWKLPPTTDATPTSQQEASTLNPIMTLYDAMEPSTQEVETFAAFRTASLKEADELLAANRMRLLEERVARLDLLLD